MDDAERRDPTDDGEPTDAPAERSEAEESKDEQPSSGESVRARIEPGLRGNTNWAAIARELERAVKFDALKFARSFQAQQFVWKSSTAYPVQQLADEASRQAQVAARSAVLMTSQLQIQRLLAAQNWKLISNLSESLAEYSWQFVRLLPTPDQLRRLTLPPNLRPESVFYDPEVYETWMLEGLPLAYVLESSTVNALAAVATAQERRRILSRRRERIVSDCEALLEAITATEVLPFVENARLAVAGYRDGHHQMAQTWAAVNLESLVKKFHTPMWSAIVDARQASPKLFRSFFFVGQLRTVMQSIGAGPVPTSFNRHGSVHFPTARRQFSKLNAMLAIAHLVSAICNYDAAAKQASARRS